MIVVDASVFIDSLFSSNAERYQKSIDFLKAVEGLPIYAPRILRVELVAVARRLGYKGERKELLEITEKLNLVGENEIINLAEYVADQIHPRAVDTYYIATAILTGSILVSNDRLMAENSGKAGIEAYYLLEEHEAAKDKLGELKQNMQD
ncbi:MAG: type II toxin-antitoxin system VapC family toxin [Desulfurococcales archaeon]|nr:type II toxin-antitoxin system VapC family toxin [Desulfurococcales archaeon]